MPPKISTSNYQKIPFDTLRKILESLLVANADIRAEEILKGVDLIITDLKSRISGTPEDAFSENQVRIISESLTKFFKDFSDNAEAGNSSINSFFPWLEELEKQITGFTEEVNELIAENNRATAQLSTFSALMHARDSDIKSRQAETAKLKEKIKRDEAEIAELKDKIKSDAAEITKLKTRIKSDQAEITGLKTRIESDQVALRLAAKESSSASPNQAKKANPHPSEDDGQATQLKEIEALKAKVRELEGGALNYQKEIADLNAQKGNLEAKNGGLNQKLAQASEKNQEINIENARLKAENEVLKTAQAEEAKLKQAIAAIRSQNESLSTKNAQLTANLEQASTEKSDVDRKIEALQEANERLKQEVAQLESAHTLLIFRGWDPVSDTSNPACAEARIATRYKK